MATEGLNKFCAEFGIEPKELGNITKLGRKYFLTLPEHESTIEEFGKKLFSAGVYLGEEKKQFKPSVALLEMISKRTKDHKAVVDDKASWLYLCRRDILDKGVIEIGEPTKEGYLLVQNQLDENLGYGVLGKRKDKNVAVKNLLDRGFFLRREQT